MNVSLIDSFVPTAGNSFTVLTYASQTGTFANFHSIGASFTRNYNAGDFTLTATHGPANYAEWKNFYFGAGSPESADNADPDHDGVSNLMEHATGGNPLHSDPVLTSQDPAAGGFIHFYYRRSIIAMAELQFQVEWNDGLSPDGWHSLGVTETILSDDGSIQQVKAQVPTNGKASRFVHLKVNSP